MEEKDLILEQEEIQEGSNFDDAFAELELNKEYKRLDLEDNYELDENDLEFKEVEQAFKDGKALGVYYQELINAGLSQEQSYQLTMNYSTCNHNIIVAKIDLEKAKIQNEIADQNRV